ncbi:isoprenylcysteine carboxylmethyltransferase family protein [Sphaerospermopsis aphanizomenoides BCCUSP55]|uniref:methyltransferase family protein n=1 Tax=Sphaerospermopsis aphanizomenoides TaxID=459663 RepID=UPI000B0A8E83|nr:isoprenylcysteine carboxylmethyltransferase family protein [Sphaerospermopsis aphanizomenoides]MBK1987672.1 isoprenylcysteine carboxylmethyltransferase family protein [Sphaerospermopsis aphanizomenoides BCCUSP55]
MSVFKAILSLLIYGFLSIGIPLLGWGIDGLTEFLANPARVIFLVGSTLITIVYAWFIPQNLVSDAVKDKLITRQNITLWLSMALYVIIFSLLPYCDRHNLWQIKAENYLRYVGLVMFTIGLIFSTWGPLHLGKQFVFNVTVKAGNKLVTDGPFSYVRHPRYFGLFVWVLGVSLIYLSVVGLVMTGVYMLLLAWRIYDEEKLLQQEFGEQWTNYCQQTKRIIPLVY